MFNLRNININPRLSYSLPKKFLIKITFELANKHIVHEYFLKTVQGRFYLT